MCLYRKYINIFTYEYQISWPKFIEPNFALDEALIELQEALL